MIITSLGHFCFKLRGRKVVVLTDPYERHENELMAKTKAEIVTFSGVNQGNVERVEGNPFVIKGAGEYEIQGVSIFGLPMGDRVAYLYRFDDLKIAHLASLPHKLTDSQVEEMGEIDLLFIPGLKKAQLIIDQLEPKIVIPMNSVKEFLKEIDKEGLKPVRKLTITSSSLPDEREVIWLKK